MPKTTEEAKQCRQYLINCFVHPKIASRFETWKQVKLFDEGYSVEDALYMRIEETPHDFLGQPPLFSEDVS